MNPKYTLSYTLYSTEDPDEPPIHKKYTFESENDIMAAMDEATSTIYDMHLAKSEGIDVLFRSMVLDNPKEVYESIRPQEGGSDE